MNIAFPAFFIYLLILPGIILRYYYRKSYFEHSPVTFGSFVEELAYGILIAGTLHLIWGFFATRLGFEIDLKTIFLCLTNQFNSIEKSIVFSTSCFVFEGGPIMKNSLVSILAFFI